MKQLIITISIIFSITLIHSSLSYANSQIIYGCYKKVDGQLRIITQPGRCLPSEVPISWNQAGPTGPPGFPGVSVESISLPEGDPNCPFGGSLFKSINGLTYACNGGEGEGSSIIVRKIPTTPCTNGYGWCPNGFSKWLFQIQDAAVNENSVVTINIVNPLLWEYGCEVATKSAGEFLIFCIGYDYVKPGTILQYAVFNP